MPLNYDDFALKIRDYLHEYRKNVKDLKSKDCSEEGCWGIISRKMYGNFNNLQALQLYASWKNSSGGIKIKLAGNFNRNYHIINYFLSRKLNIQYDFSLGLSS
jgi:hypothetical protein